MAEEKLRIRQQVLREAERLVTKDREEEHGDAVRVYALAEDLHVSLLRDFVGLAGSSLTDTRYDATTVLLSMVCVKLARFVHKPSRENIIDAIGYLALIADVLELPE